MGKRAIFDPDQLGQSSGLLDDFDGTIRKVRAKPFDFHQDGPDVLVVAIEIDADGLEEPLQDYKTVGFRDRKTREQLWHLAAPSKDGDEPVDLENGEAEELEGPYVVLNPYDDPEVDESNLTIQSGSAWGFWVECLARAGYDGQWSDDMRVFEGARCHFNRVAPPWADRAKKQGQEARDVLVPTKFLGWEDAPRKSPGKKAKSPGKKAKSTGKKAKSTGKQSRKKGASKKTGASDDLKDQVAEIIAEALEEEEGVAPKSYFPNLLVRKDSTIASDDRAHAVGLLNDTAWLESRPEFDYDPDEDTFYAVEDDA